MVHRMLAVKEETSETALNLKPFDLYERIVPGIQWRVPALLYACVRVVASARDSIEPPKPTNDHLLSREAELRYTAAPMAEYRVYPHRAYCAGGTSVSPQSSNAHYSVAAD